MSSWRVVLHLNNTAVLIIYASPYSFVLNTVTANRVLKFWMIWNYMSSYVCLYVPDWCFLLWWFSSAEIQIPVIFFHWNFFVHCEPLFCFVLINHVSQFVFVFIHESRRRLHIFLYEKKIELYTGCSKNVSTLWIIIKASCIKIYFKKQNTKSDRLYRHFTFLSK